MKILKLVTIFFCTLTSFGVLASTDEDKFNVATLTGEWKGNYTCLQGESNLTLAISGESTSDVDAVFSFNYLDKASGEFEMKGFYNPETKALNLEPLVWIFKPDNYIMVGLNGFVSDDGIYSGEVSGVGCTTFKVRKVNNLDENRVIKTERKPTQMSEDDKVSVINLYTDFYRAAERRDAEKMLSLFYIEEGVKLSRGDNKKVRNALLKWTGDIAKNKIKKIDFQYCVYADEEKLFGYCKVDLFLGGNMKTDPSFDEMLVVKKDAKWLLTAP